MRPHKPIERQLAPMRSTENMSWVRRFLLICGAILALAAIALAGLLGFGDLGLGLHGAIALVLGVLLTMAIAMGLMGLMFLSSRSGRDEQAHSIWRDRDPDAG
jgi:purine-cytosine permease-like protein